MGYQIRTTNANNFIIEPTKNLFVGILKGKLSYDLDYSFGRTVDAEVLNLRSTLVLSYGYVVFYCPPEGLIQ
ncbi:hypothetical protein GPALN_007408 [Globodera pallida]|nr:hypothetical protein GPALN_007408 [Globodera pallida]